MITYLLVKKGGKSLHYLCLTCSAELVNTLQNKEKVIKSIVYFKCITETFIPLSNFLQFLPKTYFLKRILTEATIKTL